MTTPAPVPQVKPPSASLYIGDLSPEVTEGNLFDIFNSVGPVSSIRVCRDTHTRRSLGYAYVNFHSVVDAERALDTLNNAPIAGRPCRIMWSQRDPTIRRTGVGNVFIKNLDPKITHKELYDTFSQFGSILSCKVATNEHGDSKGYGFVHFESQKSAEQATGMVHDMLLAAKKVYVGPFIPRKVRTQHMETSWTNVYVKDIDPAVTDAEFEAAFAAFGKVTSPVVVRKEGQSTCYGFVNFEEHEDATKAVDALNGSKLGEKAIFCCRAQKKNERRQRLRKEWEQQKLNKYQGINLYVKNIEDEIDDERFRKEFGAFGNVVSHKIMAENGSSKGFGFVCYSSPEEASRAIAELNGRTLTGCQKPLYVAYHEPKEIRRAKLHTQRMSKNQVRPPPGVFPPGGYMYPSAGNVPPQQFYPMPPQAVRPGWGAPPPQGFPLSAYGAPVNMVSRGGGRGRGQRGGGRGGSRRNQAPPPEQEGDLTLQTLSQYPYEQQKLFLGEKLYPLIARTHSPLAGKITGMFLDSGWSIEELFSLLTDEAKLAEKIEDAVHVLERAEATEGAQ